MLRGAQLVGCSLQLVSELFGFAGIHLDAYVSELGLHPAQREQCEGGWGEVLEDAKSERGHA
ncbi:hypothetical protein AR275_19110 [Stenotrophomonas maltophilia]|nr:hypothetical protein AR275_19110 [Stenotrophomonas maltophilia]OWB46082.1 hypothetical protein B7H27_11885 [Stenotrophomonas maltophilia]